MDAFWVGDRCSGWEGGGVIGCELSSVNTFVFPMQVSVGKPVILLHFLP